MRISLSGISAICLSCAGCVGDERLYTFNATAPTPVTHQEDEVAPQPVPSSMPWQLTPASTASVSQGEKTVVVVNDRFGRVKGTPIAIANLEKPIYAYARLGRIVAACKQSIEPQAKSIGAYFVQAAAAGPERRMANGETTQQIFFRIIYDEPSYLEVRQSSLLCTIDLRGQLVDAHPV